MEKKKILFVCLGNICRSPMAETIFEALLKEHNLQEYYEIDSAGLDNYHEGEAADKRMREHAYQHGYHITHKSRHVKTADFDYYDLILGMDDQNIRGLKSRAVSDDRIKKINRMTNYCTQFIEADAVPDPYYGGDAGFQYVIELLQDACKGLLLEVEGERKQASR